MRKRLVFDKVTARGKGRPLPFGLTTRPGRETPMARNPDCVTRLGAEGTVLYWVSTQGREWSAILREEFAGVDGRYRIVDQHGRERGTTDDGMLGLAFVRMFNDATHSAWQLRENGQ